MKTGNKGQALVETLVALALFLILASGIFVTACLCWQQQLKFTQKSLHSRQQFPHDAKTFFF